MNHNRPSKSTFSLILAGFLITACGAQSTPVSPTLAAAPASTLAPQSTAAPTLSPTVTPTPAITYAPVAPTIRQVPVTLPAGVTLEEYALKSEVNVDPLKFDPVNGPMPAVLAMRAAAKNASETNLVTQNDAALKFFDYHLIRKPDGSLEIQHGEVVVDTVMSVTPISVSQTQSDFLMYANTAKGIYLLRKDSYKEVDPQRRFAAFYGNDLLEAYQSNAAGANDATNAIHVTRNGAEIFNLPIQTPSASGDVKGFWTYFGHWVLEITDQVIMDGQSLNQSQNYQASFGFQMLNGKPFYFFQKDGKIGASYDGQPIALDYVSVPHNNCCSNSVTNPTAYDRLVSFYAVRDSIWYYVDLGMYN